MEYLLIESSVETKPEVIEHSTDIEILKRIARGNNEKMDYEIKGEDETTVWTHIHPYFGEPIDICSADWLQKIQKDYGISDTVFLAGIENWKRLKGVNNVST